MNKTLLRALAATTLALTATLPATALAAEDWTPDSHQASAGAELHWFSAEFIGSSLPIIPFLHVEIFDDVMLDVQLPLGMNIDGFDDKTRFSLGNPTVAARYAPTDGIVRWWVGGGLSAPLGAIDDDDLLIANAGSLAALGGYDSYLYARDALPIFATGGIDVRVHEMVSIQGDLEPIVYIPISQNRPFPIPDRDEAEFIIQTSVGAEFRHDSGFGAGMNFKLVWFATEDGDNAQVLMDPYVGYTGDVFFARLGTLVALDEPLGFGFDRGKVATAHVTLGGKL